MKRTKLFTAALFAAAWLTTGSVHAWDQPAQDANGVYQIGTASELEWFAEYVNSCVDKTDPENTTKLTSKAVLTADIDLAGITHLPIGKNILSGKTLQFLPNYVDNSISEKEVFGQIHLSAPVETTFFAGTMDEIEARNFQNFQKNKKEERIATEKFLSTFATHKTMLQKNFSLFLRYINSIKGVFEEYGLPILEAVVVNLPKELLPAIENSGLSVPIVNMDSLFVEPSLLTEFLDLFGMIYSDKFNSDQNFLS